MATDELTFLVSIRTTLPGPTLSWPGQENPYAATNVLLYLKKDFTYKDLDSLTLRTDTVNIVDYDGIETKIYTCSTMSRGPSLRL